MKCVASMCRSESKKLKRDAVNEALELVFTATCYVLITQFRMSVERAKRILGRIEYYSLIMLDKDECLTLQDYEEILKEEYGFILDLSKVKQQKATTKTDLIKQTAINNSLDFSLTIVAYVMLDKIGLNKKRAEIIIKRILFYANRALRNDAELKKYKELLKQKYDCEINITGR